MLSPTPIAREKNRGVRSYSSNFLVTPVLEVSRVGRKGQKNSTRKGGTDRIFQGDYSQKSETLTPKGPRFIPKIPMFFAWIKKGGRSHTKVQIPETSSNL